MSRINTANNMNIRFGGVWQDFHDNIKSAEDAKQLAESNLAEVCRERDQLRVEKENLLHKFRENVSSLTDSETNHLEAKQILECIRAEKQDLINKCLSLESQREWLEEQNKNLRHTNMDVVSSLAEIQNKLINIECRLVDEQKEVKTLTEIVFKRDEMLEATQCQMKTHKAELDVLHRSLSTKEKQFASLLKERNRLKDENELHVKELNKYRNLGIRKCAYVSSENGTDLEAQSCQQAQRSADQCSDQSTMDVNPYADLFSDIIPHNTVNATEAAAVTGIGANIKSKKALTGANDFDVRERHHAAMLGRAMSALKEAREEVVRVNKQLLNAKAQLHNRHSAKQTSVCSETEKKVLQNSPSKSGEECGDETKLITVTKHGSNKDERPLVKHQLVVTPPHSMTRRVDNGKDTPPHAQVVCYNRHTTTPASTVHSPVSIVFSSSAHKSSTTSTSKIVQAPSVQRPRSQSASNFAVNPRRKLFAN